MDNVEDDLINYLQDEKGLILYDVLPVKILIIESL